MEEKKEIKFWTINDSLLNIQEFESLVMDVERYVKLREDNGKLPQQDSEDWLQQFVEGYLLWPERKYHNFKHPISKYFIISQYSYLTS